MSPLRPDRHFCPRALVIGATTVMFQRYLQRGVRSFPYGNFFSTPLFLRCVDLAARAIQGEACATHYTIPEFLAFASKTMSSKTRRNYQLCPLQTKRHRRFLGGLHHSNGFDFWEFRRSGRVFSPSDVKQGAPLVFMMNYGCGKRKSMATPNSRPTFFLKRQATQLVGIMPQRFKRIGFHLVVSPCFVSRRDALLFPLGPPTFIWGAGRVSKGVSACRRR